MKLILSLAISMAFSALLVSGAAFVMSYDLYSKSKASERQEMCEKQKIMGILECLKG